VVVTTASPPPNTPNTTRNQGSNDEQEAQEAGIVPATLTAGPDGALWVTVDGADVQQLVAKISAVCDVLIPAQPSR